MSARSAVIQFWNWFETIESSLYEALSNQKEQEIHAYEEAINERMETICGCKVEFEVGDAPYMELTCNSGERKNVQYLCGLWKMLAPESLKDRWILNAFRQPLSAKAMHSYFEMNGKRYTGFDIKVYYEVDEANKLINLKIYCEGFCFIDEQSAKDMAVYLLELFIGELELEARIGSIEIVKAPLEEENVVLLPNLYEDICDLIIEQDWMEYHDPTMIYQAYKLNEQVHSDSLRKDILILATSHPLLFEELMNGDEECIASFQEHQAEFGYLYYEHSDRKEEEAMLRAQLEKQLHELLYPLGFARTIGGAFGTKYAYIDVAVFDRNAFYQALEKINAKLPMELTYRPYMMKEQKED